MEEVEQNVGDAFGPGCQPSASAVPASQSGIPIAVRPNYAEFAEALLIAATLYDDVELAFWLNAPQPLLKMWTPIQLLARGEAPRLLHVMRQLEDGVYI